MEATPSPQSVGREFVRQYYTLLNQAPAHLHRYLGCSYFYINWICNVDQTLFDGHVTVEFLLSIIGIYIPTVFIFTKLMTCLLYKYDPFDALFYVEVFFTRK